MTRRNYIRLHEIEPAVRQFVIRNNIYIPYACTILIFNEIVIIIVVAKETRKYLMYV